MKRLYYYFDESQCRLYYYSSEDDCRTKWRTPLGSIFIGESAIALTNEDSNQFVIHSEGKEHILRADSHRNMMVWALALQAKRDAWEKMLLLESSKNLPPRVPINNIPESCPSINFSPKDLKSALAGKDSKQLNANPMGVFRRMSVTRFTSSSSSVQPCRLPDSGRRRNSTFAEVGLLLNSDPPRRRNAEEDIVEEVRCKSQPSLNQTPSNVLTTSRIATDAATDFRCLNGANMKSESDDSAKSGECDKYSSPETESASESDRLGMIDDIDDAEADIGRLSPNRQVSEVPILRLTPDSSEWDHRPDSDNGAESGSDEIHPIRCSSPIDDSVLTQTGRNELVKLCLKLQNELTCMKNELSKSARREKIATYAFEEKEKVVTQLRESQARVTKELIEKEKNKRNQELLELQEQFSMLKNQNKFLNDEILKLSRMLQQQQFKNHSKQLTIQERQGEIDQLKRDYVFLLQSCIRLTCTDGPEMMELYMYGEKRHKHRVFALLDEARRSNVSLPNIEGITTSLCHVDDLGFKHLFVDKSLILHYVCRQLHHHYSTQLRSHTQHLIRWKQYLKKHLTPTSQNLASTPDLKCLVRGGVPESMRNKVWCAMYRTKIQDIRDGNAPGYFLHLCNSATESEHLQQHKRQIALDLLRTMPTNINFCDRTSDGIKKMQDVLNAFCLHNPKLGYCQGMNFLVGMLLLFMDAEDAFWCLVAIVERYFTPSYFDQNLIGAQADQEVLKDLLKDKLPKISNHLAELDIELSTITLNWFLSIFIDSVPLETLLRIWDCFLLEGPKVLFRFSLAVFRLQEEAILAKHDTVSIMRQLKAAAKLCFDVEGLISAAFEDLEPFPTRQEISTKQSSYYKVLKERAQKKERELQALREREKMMSQVELEGPHNHLIECAAVWAKDKVWVCHGHHHGSRVSMVNCQENIMYRLNIEFESRVMCMHVPNDDTMIFGTFSHFVHAHHTISRKKMWEVCLNASVLSLCSHQRDGVKQVFAGLSDGTLAVVENVQGRMPKPEVFYVVIGPSPVTCLQLVGRKLWCACGSNVMILSARTLDLLDQFQTSSNGLDYIFRMACGEQGVWITLRGSSILQLWDPHILTCRLLYDVRDNYCSRASKIDEAYTNHARITSVLPFDSTVLVGTADGTLIIYDVIAKKSPGQSVPSSPRPQPPQLEPGQTNAKQIQARLEKLFIEQELMENGNSDDSKTRSITASPNLTPASGASRRESSSDASNAESTSELLTAPAGANICGDNTSSIGQRTESPKQLASSSEVEIQEGRKSKADIPKTPVDRESRTHLMDIQTAVDRGNRFYTKGFRKSSFTISTPIAEENVLGKFEEELEHATKEDGESKSQVSTKLENVSDSVERPNSKKESQPKEVQLKTVQSRNASPSSGNRSPFADDEEDQNRFNYVTAGDLLSTDLGLRSEGDRSKGVASVLDLRDTGYNLKESRNKYQSLSAEDIPTWVAQEKPQPIISDTGDVTFTYKSRLPSIKAFIKKEAFELANFLKASGALERLGEESSDTTTEEQTEPDAETKAPQRRRASKFGPFFSIRPPTIDLSDSPVWQKDSSDPSIAITVEGSGTTLETINDENEQQVDDSRRSSASVHSLAQEDVMGPSTSISLNIINDDDFLSTAQFNDLLQLQDWTRTSRKGSDTASNVSFGSTEVPFSFELHLKEMIKISDKPIRSLLLASCNEEPTIVSCAGYYGDDEAVLKWTKEGDEKLWTNDPIIEVCPYTNMIKPSPYARSRLPRRASIATTALSGSPDLDGFNRSTRSSSTAAASAGILVESGLAKVQHLLSRVSDRT